MCSSLGCLCLMNDNRISTRSKATRTMSKNKTSSLCSQTLLFHWIPSFYHFFLNFYLVTSLLCKKHLSKIIDILQSSSLFYSFYITRVFLFPNLAATGFQNKLEWPFNDTMANLNNVYGHLNSSISNKYFFRLLESFYKINNLWRVKLR